MHDPSTGAAGPGREVPGGAPRDGRRRRFTNGRVVLLVVTGVSLYILGPSVAEVFSAWDRLGELHPFWVLVVLACEAASFVCIWIVQRAALSTPAWFPVATTQLASNAFNRVTPGGGATGTVLQIRMLADTGMKTSTVASAITAQSVLVSAVVAALPILSFPFILLTGTHIPARLTHAAWIGVVVFLVVAGVGAVFLTTRRPLHAVGRGIQWAVCTVTRGRRQPTGLGDRLVAERDILLDTLGPKWPEALGASLGRWGFEYLALLVTLHAIDARPQPVLVLFAFVAASVLGMIPLTPGGLGFVEAGLTATLVLADIPTESAVLATLVFRLVSFWLPLPIGVVAGLMFRRRYPRS
jgi:uncharacterized protein (TIRG00374 family)